MLNIFIKNNEIYTNPLRFVVSTLLNNNLIKINWLPDRQNADIIFDHTDINSIPINVNFFSDLIERKIYDFKNYFFDKPLIYFPNSVTPDYLGTIFYMINSFQEYFNDDSGIFDAYGRFRFEKSYQMKFNCIEENLVQKYFEEFCNLYVPQVDLSKTSRKTRIFISHDIDTINSSLIEDGLWALKKGRIDIMIKILWNEILLNPHWRNIDKIIKINSEYEIKSTFYWLMTKKISENKIKNSDYSIKQIRSFLDLPANHGIHKSCFNSSFHEELLHLPQGTNHNRYHYLKLILPASYNELETAGIKMDTSLGFAERYGFRNNYGLPFKPYCLTSNKSFNLVEVPLNIMDGTLKRYMKIPLKNTAKKIIDFIEKNNCNAIISLVWHNTYFTNYKYNGYLQEYKKLLSYLIEKKFSFISPYEIINEYYYE